SKETVDKMLAAMDQYKSEKGHRGTPYYTAYDLSFAGTDATRFSQKGFRACALTAAGESVSGTWFLENWHIHKDSPENIKPWSLWHAVNFCATFIKMMDEELDTE
ncbi:MAG: M28 family peptidase, partial [Candidatus Hodarchaeota archaeon]